MSRIVRALLTCLMPARLIPACMMLACMMLGWPGAGRADIFLAADFTLSRGLGENAYDLAISLPQSIAGEGQVTLPRECRQTAATRQSAGANVHMLISFACDRPFRPGDVIAAPWKADGARFVSNVLGVAVDRSLPGGSQGIILPVGEAAATARPLGEIAREFLQQGVWHIWLGWDHLCFVLCLALLARGRQLVGLITAFTLGHSISLAAAFFDVVHAPIPPVEASIALSITFMAREALLAMTGGPQHSLRRHVMVVAGFGLLHGLGFATALGELGVAPGEKFPALLFFNLGVETGQLLFVGGLMLVLSSLARLAFDRPVRLAALYGAGVVGAFWMVQRIAAFAA